MDEIKLTNDTYIISEIVDLFPRCTPSMVHNYRYKHKIGTNVDGRIVYTKEEVYRFINDVELENIKMRRILYNYIKHHPGIKDEELYKYISSDSDIEKLGFNWSRERTATLLADISSKEYIDDYPGLYEKSDDRLYVTNNEINTNKRYNILSGIFLDMLKKKRRKK